MGRGGKRRDAMGIMTGERGSDGGAGAEAAVVVVTADTGIVTVRGLESEVESGTATDPSVGIVESVTGVKARSGEIDDGGTEAGNDITRGQGSIGGAVQGQPRAVHIELLSDK